MESALRAVGIPFRAAFACAVSIALWVCGAGPIMASLDWIIAKVWSVSPWGHGPTVSWAELTRPTRPSEQISAFAQSLNWTWLKENADAVTNWVDTVQPGWDAINTLTVLSLGIFASLAMVVRFLTSWPPSSVPFMAVISGWLCVLGIAEAGWSVWPTVTIASMAYLAFLFVRGQYFLRKQDTISPGGPALAAFLILAIGWASPLLLVYQVFFAAE